MGENNEYVWYDFWLGYEITSLYKRLGQNRSDKVQSYVFEIRSVFKLRRVDDDAADDIYLGSERFASILPVFPYRTREEEEEEDEDCKELLTWNLSHARLGDDYGMPFDEIQTLALDALAFAKQTRNAYYAINYRYTWMEIPVVVELDVVTVQREGETVDEAMSRAIRPESLFPLHLCSFCELPTMDSDVDGVDGAWASSRKGFLKTLKWKSDRVVQGLAPVVCPVCSGTSSVGDLISTLPCGHVCHTLCVYQMLNQGVSDCCPTCAAPIPTDPIK